MSKYASKALVVKVSPAFFTRLEALRDSDGHASVSDLVESAITLYCRTRKHKPMPPRCLPVGANRYGNKKPPENASGGREHRRP